MSEVGGFAVEDVFIRSDGRTYFRARYAGLAVREQVVC